MWIREECAFVFFSTHKNVHIRVKYRAVPGTQVARYVCVIAMARAQSQQHARGVSDEYPGGNSAYEVHTLTIRSNCIEMFEHCRAHMAIPLWPCTLS